LLPLINKGAKNTINVTDEMALQGSIIIPKKEEQLAIADFFKSLDSMIQGVTKKIASLKQMKQACLVSMFPQAGETTPRVRFKGFKREWVNTKLGDVFSERVESNINGEMLSVTMNSGIIKASENGRFDNSNSDKSHYKVVKINDIAYNSMRMWQGASGCSPYEGIVSPAYTVITPSEGINSQFFAYMFKTLALIKVFRLHSQGLTSDTWNLKYPAFSKIRVYYPKDLVEQQQIASFFRSMDSQISLQEARLEKLKQIKSACLDKMFV
jgi:type I restriction enzyme S subunit